MMWTRGLNVLIVAALAGAVPQLAVAQTPQGGATAIRAKKDYLAAPRIRSLARPYCRALGRRFDAAGRERLILNGALSSKQGDVPIAFTRELDQNVRVDIQGAQPRSLVVADMKKNRPSKALSDDDAALLETLVDDSPEAFFFGDQAAESIEFVGARFRPAGAAKSYAGPFYDVFQRKAAVAALPGQPVRTKFYYFDSETKLLAKTCYEIQRSGSLVSVEVQYSGWRNDGGQPAPTQIVRLENGAQTLAISIQSAQNSASLNDSVFVEPKN